jgi:type VI secretion system protein ImpA
VGEATEVLDVQDVIAAIAAAEQKQATLSETERSERASKDQAEEMRLGQLQIQLREEGIKHLFEDSFPRPDWTALIKPARLLLISTLQARLLTMLMEALIQEHGWTGFENGLRLFRQVIETCSEKLRPLPSAGGTRFNRYSSLFRGNEPAGQYIKLPTLAFDRIAWFELNGRRICFMDFDAQVRTSRKTPTEAELIAAIAAVPSAERRQWIDAAQSAVAELARFHEAVKADLAGEPDATPEVRERNLKRLGDWTASTQRIIKESIANFEAKFKESGSTQDSDAAQGTSPPGTQAVTNDASQTAGSAPTLEVPQSREMAFAELGAAALYFETTDPHSIVSYHIRRGERWMKLPLTSVLAELVAEGHEIYGILPKPTSTPSTALGSISSPKSDVEPVERSETVPAVPLAAIVPVSTRADAVRRIQAVLSYLGRFEPHSFAKFPLAFAVEVANIPLDRILESAILNETARSALLRELGVSFSKGITK